jgi:nucleotide-binding universal stress UspA family protein
MPIARFSWFETGNAKSSNQFKLMNTLKQTARRVVSARPNLPLQLDKPVSRQESLGLKRILVPVDFSEPSLRALRYAAGLAEQFGASILPLYVAEHVLYFDEAVTFPGRNVLEEMQRKLSELARSEINELLPVYPQVLTGKPWSGIVEAAREHGIDMIVMGTQGRTGLEHMLLGSTAERVVRHAPCPVLVVRGTEPSRSKTDIDL